jgi:glycosyltransferase involved in cell wall biosynthesis
MRVLVLHNHYREPGGEDVVARSECDLLRRQGVQVAEVEFEQETVRDPAIGDLVHLTRSAVWSRDSYDRVLRLCNQFRPDLAHVHNFWMKLSPSVHAACHDAGVPTVQTLHNFRLLCGNALLFREGHICEDCVGKSPWRGVAHRCYRDSWLASGAVATMIAINRWRRTWQKDVDAFIALSEHSRTRFVAGSIPQDKIFVKPNFAQEPSGVAGPPSTSKIIVFAGRLSQEKGLTTLLTAWARAQLQDKGQLLLIGDGPERLSLEQHAATLGLSPQHVIFSGHKSHDEVLDLIGKSRALVLPSICYESFGLIIVEALACGRPAIVSDIGALSEIVHDRGVGLTFRAGDEAALAANLKSMLMDDGLADSLGHKARSEYSAKYTPDRNYEMLMRIYRFAIEQKGAQLPDDLRAFEPPDGDFSRRYGVPVTHA